MRKKRVSIRIRLIITMILLTLIPLAVTGYFLAKINEESIKTQTKEYQLALNEQLKEITHAIVDETCAELVEMQMLLNDGKLSTDHTIRLVGYKISTSIPGFIFPSASCGNRGDSCKGISGLQWILSHSPKN